MAESTDRAKQFAWVRDLQKDMAATKRRKAKKKIVPLNAHCPVCEAKVGVVSYKDVYLLKRFLTTRGKIIARVKSGACAKHQRQVAKAVKRARQLALLPYVNAD